MKELFQVVSLEGAQELLRRHSLLKRCSEDVELVQALDRKLAVDIIAAESVPGFHRSTVDGYAVRAADSFGASESLPGLFSVIGEVAMGCSAEMNLQKNEAVAIPTGGMLPINADAVVMIEYTEKLDQFTIEVAKSVAPGDNVLREGEDFVAGHLVLAKGTKLGPFEIGLAAAAGYSVLPVEIPFKVGIISTGEELVMPNITPSKGQVRDINSYCLGGLVKQCGAEPVLYGIVHDNKEELQEVLHQALKENDLVLISGGSSVGTRDITLDVLASGLLFHGVAIRPGKPTLASVLEEKLVLGLPGHPASAAISFYLLVKPILENDYELSKGKSIWAILSRNLSSGPGREDFVRVKLESRGGDTWAIPVLGKSGLISTLAEADGIVRIPLNKEGLSAGEKVEVILL